MSSSLFASGSNRTSAPCNLRRTFYLTKAHPWSHSLPSVGLLVQVIVVSAIAHWAEFLFLLRTGRRRTHISCRLAGRWNGHGHPHVVRGLGEELGGVANLAGRHGRVEFQENGVLCDVRLEWNLGGQQHMFPVYCTPSDRKGAALQFYFATFVQK